MLRRTETSISVEHDVDRSTTALFAVLVDPRRHVAMDASGMLRAAEGAVVIDHIDQVFSMAMHYPSLRGYITDNRVVEFEPNSCLTWATGRRGQPAAGVRWGWQLISLKGSRTRIVHTYDWSRVVDPAVLQRVSFPRVSPARLQESVERLVALASTGPVEGKIPVSMRFYPA